MANPTSGFQLSALPQPLSMPSNLGKFDVGETQQAYANALKNAQQTALLAPQTQAAVAQAGYQTDLAREGIKRLPAETQKLLAQYGADALTAEKSALTSKAQMPYVAPTAADQARTQQVAANVGAKIAEQTQQPLILTGVSQAESASKFAELAAKSSGGIPQQKIKIGGIDYPVFFTQERTPIIGPALAQAAKVVKGEVVRVLKRETDSSGQVLVTVKRSLVHGNDSETEKSTETYAEGQAPQQGFYPNPSYSETQEPQATLPQAEQLRGLFTPSAQQTPAIGLTPLGTYSQTAPQMGVATSPGSALATAPVATTPAVATPAETSATAPVVTPVATSPAQQTTTVTPAPQPQKEQVVIPWKGNVAVSIDDPAAKAKKEFETYANKPNKAPLSPKAVTDNTVAAKEIRKEYKELDSQLNALNEVARTAENLQKEFKTGWLQAKINPAVLAQFGLPAGQSFDSAVNALIQNLSDKTQFRNFGVVDLIRQSKPTREDSPEEIRRKMDYFNFMITRAKESNEAIRSGIVDYKIPAELAKGMVDRNYSVGNRESYENWKKNISTYSGPDEQNSMITGAKNFIKQNQDSKDPAISKQVQDVRAKLNSLGVNL
jgi:hypothetical protein